MTEPLQTEPLDLATAGQRHALVLDFAPLVLATPVLTAPVVPHPDRQRDAGRDPGWLALAQLLNARGHLSH